MITFWQEKLFTLKPVPSLPDGPHLVMQLLSDLSFRAYLEGVILKGSIKYSLSLSLKQIWQLTSVLYRHLDSLCLFDLSAFVQDLSSSVVKFSGFAFPVIHV